MFSLCSPENLWPKTQFLDNLVRMPILLFLKRKSFFPQGKLFIEATWLGLPSSCFPQGTVVQYSKSSSLSQATWLGWPLNPLHLMKRFLFPWGSCSLLELSWDFQVLVLPSNLVEDSSPILTPLHNLVGVATQSTSQGGSCSSTATSLKKLSRGCYICDASSFHLANLSGYT